MQASLPERPRNAKSYFCTYCHEACIANGGRRPASPKSTSITPRGNSARKGCANGAKSECLPPVAFKTWFFLRDTPSCVTASTQPAPSSSRLHACSVPHSAHPLAAVHVLSTRASTHPSCSPGAHRERHGAPSAGSLGAAGSPLYHARGLRKPSKNHFLTLTIFFLPLMGRRDSQALICEKITLPVHPCL